MSELGNLILSLTLLTLFFLALLFKMSGGGQMIFRVPAMMFLKLRNLSLRSLRFFSAQNEGAGLFSQFPKEIIFAQREQHMLFKVTKFKWLS